MAGFHQDVTVRGEFREIRSDHVGGGRSGHRSGVDCAWGDVGRPPEEDHEQRDGAESANVRHLARISRLIVRRTVGALLTTIRNFTQFHPGFDILSTKTHPFKGVSRRSSSSMVDPPA